MAFDMGQRLMQKARGVWDLNYFLCGRKIHEKPIGGLQVQYSYRTGFFGGRMDLGEVPVTQIKRVNTLRNPEGLDIIMPFKKDSPGYHEFITMPLFKMQLLETRLAELELDIQSRIESAAEMKSFAQLQETVFSIVDMIKEVRKQTEMIQGTPQLAALPETGGE